MVVKGILTDQELFVLLKEGHTGAYTEIFDRYQPVLYIYACRITKDEDEAADLVQEVFLSLWNRKESLDLNSTLLAYLYSAVRFRFFNLLDKKKVRADYAHSLKRFMEAGSFATDNQLEEREILRLIEQQVQYLPPKLKLIYELRNKANLTTTQIADQTGVSEKTVQNQMSLAIKQLKLKLGLLQAMVFILMKIEFIELLKKL